jgi:hypothetical protein
VIRLTVVLLCFTLCLSATRVPAASAVSRLATLDKTALVLCLQQVSLMRDAYRSIFAKYPTLTTFSTVAADEVAMLATLKRAFARYKIAVPTSNARVSAALTLANTVTNISMAHSVAINLERSTAIMMTQLLQRTGSHNVPSVVALVKTTSLGSHTTAFTAEKATIATPPTPPTPPATLPVTRPFPAPVTTRTVTVPASIDATGSSDVGAALNAFVASVPDGSIIAFPTGATYMLNEGIQIANRHNLVFAGNGVTLRVGPKSRANDQLASSFVLGHQYGGYWANGNTDIVIRDFVLVGNDPTPGTFTEGQEGQANLQITGTDRVEIYNITGSAAPGDFVFIADVLGAWVHDCRVLTTGRNGGTIVAGRDITFERNAFGVIGYCVFDVEPNNASEATYNARFLVNTAISWGNAFLAVEGSHTGAMIDGIVVDGNTVTGGSIRTIIDNGGTNRMKNISFTNNTGGKATAGPVLRFAYVDGLTVTGNVQPLSSGILMNILNCTGVVTP